MAERIEVLLTEEEVDKRIQEIGDQISRDYAGKSVHLVCVLKRPCQILVQRIDSLQASYDIIGIFILIQCDRTDWKPPKQGG